MVIHSTASCSSESLLYDKYTHRHTRSHSLYRRANDVCGVSFRSGRSSYDGCSMSSESGRPPPVARLPIHLLQDRHTRNQDPGSATHLHIAQKMQWTAANTKSCAWFSSETQSSSIRRSGTCWVRFDSLYVTHNVAHGLSALGIPLPSWCETGRTEVKLNMSQTKAISFQTNISNTSLRTFVYSRKA